MQYSPDQYSIVKFIEENKHLDLKAIIKAAENEVDEPVPPAKDRDDMENVAAENPSRLSIAFIACSAFSGIAAQGDRL